MAISDELNRIILAKAGIRSALAEKGLTIGDSSTLDEYPALILEMETGGGGSSADTLTLIDMIESDITSIVIPSGVKKIGHSAFMNRKYLTSVQIPSDVSNIEMQAFSGCTALRSIDLPSACTKISVSLLSGCLNLESFVVKDTVTEIDTTAFNNIGNNVSFAMLPTIPPTLLGSGSYTFGGNNATWPIYVKNSVVDDYKTAGGFWNDVSTRITPLVSMSYDKVSYTINALGRGDLLLYVDGSLCNSSSYTFDLNTESGSHTILVKSIDTNLGVLDTSTAEITVTEYTEQDLFNDLYITIPYTFDSNNKNDYVTFNGSKNTVNQNLLTITNDTTISDPDLVTVLPNQNLITYNTTAGNIVSITQANKVNNSTVDMTIVEGDGAGTRVGSNYTWKGESPLVSLKAANVSTWNSSISKIDVNIIALNSDVLTSETISDFVIDTDIQDSRITIIKAESNATLNKIYTNRGEELSNPYVLPNAVNNTTIKLYAIGQDYGSGYSLNPSTFEILGQNLAQGTYSTTFNADAITAATSDSSLLASTIQSSSGYDSLGGKVILTDGIVLFYCTQTSSMNKYPAQFRFTKSKQWYLNKILGGRITSVVFNIDPSAAASYDGDTNVVSDGELSYNSTDKILTWSNFTNDNIKMFNTVNEQMRVISVTINYEID